MSDCPPSMRWVPLFVDSLNRSLMGDLHGWDVEEEADPLRRVLYLRFKRPIRKLEVPFIRGMLMMWAETNDCVYRRSKYKKHDFRALIVLKGLGPPREKSPWEEK